MSSSDLGSIHLQSRRPVVMTLFDSSSRPVASGIGSIRKTDLPPGIYTLEMRAGSSYKSVLIRLSAGQTYDNLDFDLPFVSVLPLRGGTDYDARHLPVVQQLTDSIRGPDSSGLVVLLRSLSHRPQPIQEQAYTVTLLNTDLYQLKPSFHASDSSQTCLGSAFQPGEGGFLLRLGTNDEGCFDHPIWLTRGFTTLVFVPVVGDKVRNSQMSVQMINSYQTWPPDDEWSSGFATAIDLALSGLSVGKSIVPKSQLEMLLDAKADNPVLGIVGAYSLILRRERKTIKFTSGSLGGADEPFLNRVVERLAAMLPNHPDVETLRYMGTGHHASGSLRFPPMFSLGFRSAIVNDAIAEGSFCDYASAWYQSAGPWTAWPSPSSEKIKDAMKRDRGEINEAQRVVNVVRDTLLETAGSLLKKDSSAFLSSDPARQIVSSYLRRVKTLKEEGDTCSPSIAEEGELSQRLDLPRSAVRRALGKIDKKGLL